MSADDPHVDQYRFEFSPPEKPATMAVVGAAADILETDPMELPAVAKSIPCDALDEIINEGEDSTVTFSYEGLRITVHGSGELVIQDLE